MKTRILIIIGMIIAHIGLIPVFTPEFIFGENLYDEFQNAMKRCAEPLEGFAYGTVIQNSTHYFDDTIACIIFDNRMIKGSDDISAEKRVNENLPDFLKPPLKQFQSGIPADKIQCNEGFLKVIKKSNGNPACIKPETKSELVQRNWIQFQFSFCGADGFDSKGNLNKSNSTHYWDENYCKWWPVGYDPSLHQEEQEQLQMKKILDQCSCVSLGLETDQPYLQYENQTHIITNDTCEWRKMHLR